MDDKIKETLNKVILLAQQNREFGVELRKRLQITSSVTSVCVDDNKINQIEKYLGLDYRTDGKDSVIDYSYITMPDVKDLLESDNREMMRFRYGTRYHKIDFMEFCRYAHMQSEMLLNYYYDKRNNSNLARIKEQILSFFPLAKGVREATSLSAIPYYAKLKSFQSEYQNIDIIYTFNNLRTIRNELSHRSPNENEQEVALYKENLKKLGLPISPKGWIDTERIKNNSFLQNIYETRVKSTKDYNKYCLFLWTIGSPYDKIIGKLRDLSKTIAENS